MKLLAQLQEQLDSWNSQGLRRHRRVMELPCAPQVRIDGIDMLSFCSNDYLGLAAHPALIQALQEGASLYGVGSGASHLISGHGRAHAALEKHFSHWMSPYIESARALYFGTGYMANLAVLTALTRVPKDGKEATAEIFSEALNHASLIDGARLSPAKISIYRHDQLEVLAGMLEVSTADVKLVATDSVFSMDGILAPLPQLLALCEKHQAWLIVDDAHGFGILGERGHGVLEHFQLRSPYLIYIGTLGKAAGVSGALVAAHESVIEWLVQRARPYIYTTAAPPALAHALLTSLGIIESAEGDRRRQHLNSLIRQLRDGLKLKNKSLLPSVTAIQPIVCGSNEHAMQVSAALYEQGIWVPAIRPPTVPKGTARLRVSLSAAHTPLQLERLIETLNALDGTFI